MPVPLLVSVHFLEDALLPLTSSLLSPRSIARQPWSYSCMVMFTVVIVFAVVVMFAVVVVFVVVVMFAVVVMGEMDKVNKVAIVVKVGAVEITVVAIVMKVDRS